MKFKIEDKKNKKRERIIEAASELFSKKNFHEVMMEDVARLASIAKGTLYNYFDSKEDLYFWIMVMRMENLIHSLKEKIQNEATAVDSLHTFVIHNYMFMVKYSCFFLMFQKDNLAADNSFCAEFRLKKTELKDLLKNIIDSGKAQRLFRNINSELAGDLVLGSIYSAVNRAIDNDLMKEYLDTERENLFDFILKGVSTLSDNPGVLPLRGKNILLTRSTEDSKESALLFSRQGAEVLSFPTLEIVPPESWEEFDEAVRNSYDILIFTSANAIRMFLKRIAELNILMDYDYVTIAAVGRKTAALLQKNNIPVNIVPKEYNAEGLMAELAGIDLKGRTVLIPSSSIARDELPSGLKEKGAIVKAPSVYNVALPPEEVNRTNIEALKTLRPDLFIFTSPSSFRNFLQIMMVTEPVKYFDGLKIAAIGPTTKMEIEKENLRVDIFPDEYTMEGLLKAVINNEQFKINN